jgi:hypothetical protein
LAWRISDHFEVASTAILFREAAASSIGVSEPPKLFTDGGVENLNAIVDALIASGLIKRVLAETDVTFSNSTPSRRCAASPRSTSSSTTP